MINRIKSGAKNKHDQQGDLLSVHFQIKDRDEQFINCISLSFLLAWKYCMCCLPGTIFC